MPENDNVPVPVQREVAAAPVEAEEVVTAYAAPAPAASPAAQILRIPAPTPKEEVGEGDQSEVDPVTTASASPGGWMVQIGSTGSPQEAKALLSKAVSQVGAPVASLSPYTEKFQKGSITYHRARFAGISSAKAANSACAALKRQSFNCFAIAPQS